MAHINKKKKLRPSILNRLIDNNLETRVEIDQGQHQKLTQLRDSVRRDLENLLNTRFRIIEPPIEFKELKKSLLNYGLPDLATVNISNMEIRKDFIQQLESTITENEPRFKQIKVTYIENQDTLDRTFRFRIDATLYADPSPEIVVFDSTLEPVTRSLNIEEISHG